MLCATADCHPAGLTAQCQQENDVCVFSLVDRSHRKIKLGDQYPGATKKGIMVSFFGDFLKNSKFFFLFFM